MDCIRDKMSHHITTQLTVAKGTVRFTKLPLFSFHHLLVSFLIYPSLLVSFPLYSPHLSPSLPRLFPPLYSSLLSLSLPSDVPGNEWRRMFPVHSSGSLLEGAPTHAATYPIHPNRQNQHYPQHYPQHCPHCCPHFRHCSYYFSYCCCCCCCCCCCVYCQHLPRYDCCDCHLRRSLPI